MFFCDKLLCKTTEKIEDTIKRTIHFSCTCIVHYPGFHLNFVFLIILEHFYW